nr:hypothetical protein [Tanacetum cinerariifolium]
MDLHDKGVIDSGCSRHITGNMSYLTDYEEINGGYVAFGGNLKGGKITGRGTKACDDASKARMETVPVKDYILLPLWTANPLIYCNLQVMMERSDHEDDDEIADMNNLDTTIQVSPTPTTRIHKDHPLDQVIGDLYSTTQIRPSKLFVCLFLSQEEPKMVIHALKDPSWIEAVQEELLQFKLQEVWTLVDLPCGDQLRPLVDPNLIDLSCLLKLSHLR